MSAGYIAKVFMDHSPGKNPRKKEEFECEAKYVPAKFVAGLYQSLTGDDKRHQMYECYKKAKNNKIDVVDITTFMKREFNDDEDITIEWGGLWFALSRIQYDSMVGCPNVDNQYMDE